MVVEDWQKKEDAAAEEIDALREEYSEFIKTDPGEIQKRKDLVADFLKNKKDKTNISVTEKPLKKN